MVTGLYLNSVRCIFPSSILYLLVYCLIRSWSATKCERLQEPRYIPSSSTPRRLPIDPLWREMVFFTPRASARTARPRHPPEGLTGGSTYTHTISPWSCGIFRRRRQPSATTLVKKSSGPRHTQFIILRFPSIISARHCGGTFSRKSLIFPLTSIIWSLIFLHHVRKLFLSLCLTMKCDDTNIM